MGSTEQIGQSKGRRLDSWKAIAQYLDRDVRSVQRWERERGLPVYRLPGQKGGAVFAYESELEHWLRSGQKELSTSTDSEAQIPDSSASTPLQPSAQILPAARARARTIGVAIAVIAILLAAIAVLRWNLKSLRPYPSSARAIAVLPMQNLSGDAAQDYFADGFTEELVTELAQVRSLRVISRTSTMLYKGSKKPLPEIARELQVNLILEGSVVRDRQRVRVTAQLIDALNDTHLWARTYDADVKDVLDIQSQISRAIAEDVRLDLSPEEKARLASIPTVDPEAHDLYLKASYQFAQQTANSIRQSLVLYQAAAAKDPSFAMAYVGIAQAEAALLQITAETPDESLRHERDALAKALTIDPHLGDAHGMLASLAYYRDWDWPRAEREFQLALAEGARAPTEQRYGVALSTRGRFEEGTAHLQSALELDPLGRSPRVGQFFGSYLQRKYAEGRHEMEELLSSNPDFMTGHLLLGLAAMMQHDCAEAAAQAEWTQKHFPSPVAEFEPALASSCSGDVPSARRHLEAAAASKGPAFASPYQIALGYAFIHDNETALSYLQKSAELREPQVLYIKTDPVFDEIRSDPRFVALEKKVGL